MRDSEEVIAELAMFLGEMMGYKFEGENILASKGLRAKQFVTQARNIHNQFIEPLEDEIHDIRESEALRQRLSV